MQISRRVDMIAQYQRGQLEWLVAMSLDKWVLRHDGIMQASHGRTAGCMYVGCRDLRKKSKCNELQIEKNKDSTGVTGAELTFFSRCWHNDYPVEHTSTFDIVMIFFPLKAAVTRASLNNRAARPNGPVLPNPFNQWMNTCSTGIPSWLGMMISKRSWP